MKTIKAICAEAFENVGGSELERTTQQEREALERAVNKAREALECAANKALHKPNEGMPSEIAAQVFEYVNRLKSAAFTMGIRIACNIMTATLITDEEKSIIN